MGSYLSSLKAEDLRLFLCVHVFLSWPLVCCDRIRSLFQRSRPRPSSHPHHCSCCFLSIRLPTAKSPPPSPFSPQNRRPWVELASYLQIGGGTGPAEAEDAVCALCTAVRASLQDTGGAAGQGAEPRVGSAA